MFSNYWILLTTTLYIRITHSTSRKFTWWKIVFWTRSRKFEGKSLLNYGKKIKKPCIDDWIRSMSMKKNENESENLNSYYLQYF
jgi:hypothetical protein